MVPGAESPGAVIVCAANGVQSIQMEIAAKTETLRRLPVRTVAMIPSCGYDAGVVRTLVRGELCARAQAIPCGGAARAASTDAATCSPFRLSSFPAFSPAAA